MSSSVYERGKGRTRNEEGKKKKRKVNEKKTRQNMTACGAKPVHGGTWVKAVWRYLGRS